MRSTETRGHRLFVPDLGGAHHREYLWKLRAVTQGTVQRGSDAPRALGVFHHPGCTPKRRSVPDVLAVEAGEVCDPVAGVVSTEPGDDALHDRSVGECGRRSRVNILTFNGGSSLARLQFF
jgi:hypothetical protein